MRPSAWAGRIGLSGRINPSRRCPSGLRKSRPFLNLMPTGHLKTLPCISQRENRNLRADIESDSSDIAKSPINVELSTIKKFDLSARISRVVDGKNRRREKRRFALPAMSVAAKNPTSITIPVWQIGPVGIVKKHQACLFRFDAS